MKRKSCKRKEYKVGFWNVTGLENKDRLLRDIERVGYNFYEQNVVAEKRMGED